MCNWTVWCTQNVLLTSFLGSFDENTRKAVFQKSADSCDYFLKDYGDDGCCNEGAQYYRHAGLCLFNTMNILNEVSGGCFEELFHRQKIRNIASYILNVHVNDKYYFNFADCSPIAGRAGVREFLFGQKISREGQRQAEKCSLLVGPDAVDVGSHFHSPFILFLTARRSHSTPPPEHCSSAQSCTDIPPP